MVSTRSGRSSNDKSVIPQKSLRKCLKVSSSKESVNNSFPIFMDSSENDYNQSEIVQKNVFRINRNANRLSHNHIRYEEGTSPLKSNIPNSSNLENINSHQKKHKIDEEIHFLPENSDITHSDFHISRSKPTPTGSNKKSKISTTTNLSPVKRDIFPQTQISSITDVTATVNASSIGEHSIMTKPVIIGGGIKRLAINEEEKQMNGAPEGELYDVVLLSDLELPELSLTEDQSLFVLLQDQMKIYFTLDKNGWAKQYEIITFIRQSLSHHLPQIGSFDELQKNQLLAQMLKVLTDGVMSLRSSNIRNSLLAIQHLFSSALVYNTFISNTSTLIWNFPEFQGLIVQLLLKTGSNPKFVAIEAFNVLQKVIHECSFHSLLSSSTSASSFFCDQYLLHRNLDISYYASSLFHEKLIQNMLTPCDLHATVAISPSLIKLMYQALTQGKKFQSKEKISLIFHHLKEIIYQGQEETFRQFLQEQSNLTMSQIEEVLRGMKKETASSSIDKENDSSSIAAAAPAPTVSVIPAKVVKKPSVVSAGDTNKPWLKMAAMKGLHNKDTNINALENSNSECLPLL